MSALVNVRTNEIVAYATHSFRGPNGTTITKEVPIYGSIWVKRSRNYTRWKRHSRAAIQRAGLRM